MLEYFFAFQLENGSKSCNLLLSGEMVTSTSGLELGGMKTFSGEIKPFFGRSVDSGGVNLNSLP